MDRNTNGTFKKGSNPNPKGRPKGSTNQTTAEIREFFTNFISDNIHKLQEDFNELEPKERLRFIIEVSKYILPTLKAVDLITNLPTEEKKPVFNIIFKPPLQE